MDSRHVRFERPKRTLSPPEQGIPAGKRNKKRQKKASSDNTKVGCPLFIKDPVAYFLCIIHWFTRPADVLQHMRRSHMLAIYCADCYDTFDTESDRDAHTRLRWCTQRQPPPDTVLPEMVQMPRSGGLVEKWYALWDSLFTSQARPSSPFMHGDCRDVFRVIRQMDRNLSVAGSSASSDLDSRLANLEALYNDFGNNTGTVGNTANFIPHPQLSQLSQPAAMESQPLLSQATEDHESPMMSGPFDSMPATDGEDGPFSYEDLYIAYDSPRAE